MGTVMGKLLRQLAAAAIMLIGTAMPAAAQPLPGDRGYLTLVDELIGAILANPAFVAEVEGAHRALPEPELPGLDKAWRSGDDSIKSRILANPMSKFLTAFATASGGQIAEVFVMDHRGLIVAMSAPTSDFVQSDEDKWRKTFAVGPAAEFVDGVEFDDSTRKWLQQLSKSIAREGKAIGAITVGIDIAHR